MTTTYCDPSLRRRRNCFAMGGPGILMVDGLSTLQQRVDNTTLTKPFTGADLLGVINSLLEAAR
nr:hypothetical protein [Sinorhizobium meliloti]